MFENDVNTTESLSNIHLVQTSLAAGAEQSIHSVEETPERQTSMLEVEQLMQKTFNATEHASNDYHFGTSDCDEAMHLIHEGCAYLGVDKSYERPMYYFDPTARRSRSMKEVP